LSELLFIQIIRLWIDQQAEASVGWVAALRVQSISAALGLIHQSPAHKWTVNELAEAVALSRSAFSARFTKLVGEPPMTYLRRSIEGLDKSSTQHKPVVNLRLAVSSHSLMCITIS
jgi:hypothetical protein